MGTHLIRLALQVLQSFGELSALLGVIGRKMPELIGELIATRQFEPSQFHLEEITPERRIRLAPGSLGALPSMTQTLDYFGREVFEHVSCLPVEGAHRHSKLTK
jgi:hypothetical protein